LLDLLADLDLMNHLRKSIKTKTGMSSFSCQAMNRVKTIPVDKRPTDHEQIQVIAGRHCELLVLKLNCTFALFQHCSAAHLQLPKNLQKESQNSNLMMKWLCEGNRSICMGEILKKMGHPFCAKFLFQFREQEVKPSSKPTSKSSTKPRSKSSTKSGSIPEDRKGCMSSLSKKFQRPNSLQGDSSDDNSEKTSSIAKAVEAALKPFVKTLATKEDLSGLATKAELEEAMKQVRKQAVLDSAANVGLAMSEAVEKAEQKIGEIADHAISKIESKSLAPPPPPEEAKDSQSKHKKRKKGKSGLMPGTENDQHTLLFVKCFAHCVFIGFI